LIEGGRKPAQLGIRVGDDRSQGRLISWAIYAAISSIAVVCMTRSNFTKGLSRLRGGTSALARTDDARSGHNQTCLIVLPHSRASYLRQYFPSHPNSRNDNEVVMAPAGIFGPELECQGHRRHFSPSTSARSGL
jgi:hypothetical protein